MTVIAWDGDTLASDTLCTGLDDGTMQGDKIWRTPSGLFGGAGDDPAIEIVRLWLMSGSRLKNRPPSFGEGVEFSGLLIAPNRDVFFIDKNILPVRYRPQRFAIGSGQQAALALMAVGLTAPEAVKTIIEKQIVSGVGGEVQSLTLKKRKAGIRKR